MRALCRDCGRNFEREPGQPWRIRCYACWRQHKRLSDDGTRTPALAVENEKLRALLPYALTLRRLLQLCHPDKHGQSEAANEATRWLLRLREALKELAGN